MSYHLSIFVENKPGKLEKITKILADNNINILSISIASAGEFGVVKILVDKTDEAYDILSKNNVTVSKRKIIIAAIDDKPGSFHNILTLLSSNNINIEDSYGFVMEFKKRAAVVIEVEKFPDVENILKNNNINLIDNLSQLN